MILWLRPEILKDRLFPVPLHVVPVVNHSVSNGIVYAIARSLDIGQGFVTDEEVEVFDPSFGC